MKSLVIATLAGAMVALLVGRHGILIPQRADRKCGTSVGGSTGHDFVVRVRTEVDLVAVEVRLRWPLQRQEELRTQRFGHPSVLG